MPTFGFGSSSQSFDLVLKKPNIIAAISSSSIATTCESAKLSCPLIWNQENDTYYEQSNDGYYRYVGSNTEITSSSGYKFQPDLTANSYVKVCNMWEDRTVYYYITLDPTTFRGEAGFTSSGQTNPTVGKIAGTLERIICDFSGNNAFTISTNPVNTDIGYQRKQAITRLQINGLDQSPNYSYTYSLLTRGNHNLITGSRIRCTQVGNSGLTLNRIYYAIKINNTSFSIANTYEDAFNNLQVNVTQGSSVNFMRQSGWIVVEEGGPEYGNGGSPLYGGTGNTYIRNPYNTTTRTNTLLPIYNSNLTYNTGDRVLHSVVISQVNTVLVWECLDRQNADNAITPALGLVDADMTGVHGDTMLEIPEFYVRKDHFDGVKFRNCKGEDVSKDYTLVSSSNSPLALNITPLSTGDKQDIFFTWVLHKSQFNKLSDLEKRKYILSPVFMLQSDSLQDRSYRLTWEEAGLFMPSGNILADGTESILGTLPDHYLVVGKAINYNNVTIPAGLSITNLTPGVYYVSSIVDATRFNISYTKGGTSITTIHISGYSSGLKGYCMPVVTKTVQNVVSVTSGTSSAAIFTTELDHQLLVGQKVKLIFSGSITNFTSGTTYYVMSPNYSSFTFQLASTLSNSVNNIPIQFSAASNTSNVYVVPEVVLDELNPKLIVNGLSGTDTLNLDWLPGYTSHYLRTGDAVVYEGALNGLTNGAVYYAIQVNWGFSIKLATSYENAMLNKPITTLSGVVEGSTIKRSEYTDIQFSGTPRSILTVNKEVPQNSYRAVYKGMFNGTVDAVKIEVSISLTSSNLANVNGSPLTFYTTNNHGLKNTDFVYLVYSERCNLVNFTRYHPITGYWVKRISDTGFQLATSQNGTSVNYSNSSSPWQNFTETGGMRVILYKANSTKIKEMSSYDRGLSLGIFGVGNNNDITLCVEADEMFFNYSYSQLYRTGQQVTFGIYRDRQGAVSAEYSSLAITQVTGTPSLFRTAANTFIRNDLKIRFRSIGSLSGINVNTVYRVTNKNDSTGDFQLVNNSTNDSITVSGTVGGASIKPIIFDEIEPGDYFLRSNLGNATVTLHRTYNESLSGANPVSISSQPNYRNSQSVKDSGSPFNNFYGQFRRACENSSNDAIVDTVIASRAEATNKNLNYYKGTEFISDAMKCLAYQEGRKYNYYDTQVIPFTRSARVAMFYNILEYVGYQENLNIYYSAVPYKNSDVLKPIFSIGNRYNSLLGCFTVKGYDRWNYASHRMVHKTGIIPVFGSPKNNTSTATTGYLDFGYHRDYTSYGAFSSTLRTYLLTIDYSSGRIIVSNWNYFLCT